jgi:glyoxylase-like metal-dependent hydrolase (beta-lactamase superfamily II)
MIEKIMPGIFKIELPMPYESLKTVNVYLLQGQERNLVIDSGINKPDCKAALVSAFQELEVNLANTDFFITHLHEDHFGLAPELAARDARIYLNAPEAAFWGAPDRWAEGFAHGQRNGFPGEELVEFMRKEPDFLQKLPLTEMKKAVTAYLEQVPSAGRLQIIEDGATLFYGEYILQCLMTPGHSSGHLCLYEPQKKLFFSGDHILETITPAIFLWPGEDRNPLGEYLDSLDKVADLDVDLILPGHRETFRKHRGRLLELKKHHEYREHEIAAFWGINGHSGKTAYEIASGMRWNIPATWKHFTTELKWMALAETLAHLQYMEQQGKILNELMDDGVEYYFLQTG